MAEQKLSPEDMPAGSQKALVIPKTDDPGTGAAPGMPNIEARNVIGIFESRQAAESAAQALQQDGIAPDLIIIADQPVGTAPEISASDTRASDGLWSGAIVGALAGLMIGIVIVAVPAASEGIIVGP